jgi:hypothetical protein
MVAITAAIMARPFKLADPITDPITDPIIMDEDGVNIAMNMTTTAVEKDIAVRIVKRDK